VRVIAGYLGSRPLRAPRGHETRPTIERVRGAIFEILAGRVSGARVLDAYAGSGALGIEAISRGAGSATFIEASRPALVALRHNVETLELGGLTTVVPTRLEKCGAALERVGPFDLVLCDPPWDDVEHALDSLVKVVVPHLVAGATVVVEHRARRPPRSRPELVGLDERAWGDTGASFFAAKPAD
jgi:16S rRNA (guanine966-N2)-methyltransferase